MYLKQKKMKIYTESWKRLINWGGKTINIVCELDNAIEILNNTDEYTSTLIEELSVYDKKTTDLLHFIENNNLNAAQSCKVIKEIKKIRQERRKVKNDMEISKVYKDNINKLINKDSRNILMNKIHKTEKQLESKYQNRIYTEEDIQNIFKGGDK